MTTFHPPELAKKLQDYTADPMIRDVMLPKDTNALGSIFGGVILSQLDLAASEEARKAAGRNVVTKFINEVDFIAPVEMGDWVSYYTRIDRIGTTSITVQVLVVAHRGDRRDELYEVTEAEVVFVAVDEEGRPAKVKVE